MRFRVLGLRVEGIENLVLLVWGLRFRVEEPFCLGATQSSKKVQGLKN